MPLKSGATKYFYFFLPAVLMLLISISLIGDISAQSCSPRGEICIPRIGADCCSPLRCPSINGGICFDQSLSLPRGSTCYNAQECSSGSCVGNKCCDISLDLAGGITCYCDGECLSNDCSGGTCTTPQCDNFPNCFCCPRFEPSCDESDCGMSEGNFSKDSSKDCPIIAGRPASCCCGNCALAGKSCSSYSCCFSYTCLSGICQKERFRGESCGSPSYYFCSSGLSCVGGTCCNTALSLPGNSACYCDGECISGQCVSGICYVDPCESVDCGLCAYCTGGNCINYCPGDDGNCGCSSCINCHDSDEWYDAGSSYTCCDGQQVCSACQEQQYRNYYCSGTSCGYSVTDNRTLKDNCSDCPTDKYCSFNVGCIDYQDRGEECSPTVPCTGDFVCLDGICIDEDRGLPGGEPCFAGEECISGVCQGGQCAFGINIINPLQNNELQVIIQNIIDFIFRVSLVLAPLMIIVAGFLFATAQGDYNKVNIAKKVILWTAIGFLIVLLSKGIFDAVIGLFLGG